MATTPNNPKLKWELIVSSQCLTLINIASFLLDPVLETEVISNTTLQLCKLLEVSEGGLGRWDVMLTPGRL